MLVGSHDSEDGTIRHSLLNRHIPYVNNDISSMIVGSTLCRYSDNEISRL